MPTLNFAFDIKIDEKTPYRKYYSKRRVRDYTVLMVSFKADY